MIIALISFPVYLTSIKEQEHGNFKNLTFKQLIEEMIIYEDGFFIKKRV